MFFIFKNIEKYSVSRLLNCCYILIFYSKKSSFIQILRKKFKYLFKHGLKSLKIQKQDLRRFVEIYHIPIKLWGYELQLSSLSLFSETKKFKGYVEGERCVQKFKQLHFWADKTFQGSTEAG